MTMLTEPQRISKQFNLLFHGTPWIDANISSTLKEFTWRDAASRVRPGMNSTWEIVNHLISWRETALKRLTGQAVEIPADNFFRPVTGMSPASWKETQKRFAASHAGWKRYFKKLSAVDLNKNYSAKNFTRYELILGILQHDAYHLGQIRLLRRMKR
jgi:DinB family protein